MNYQKIYDQLISKRKSYPIKKPHYFERHHITPRCIGGNNNPENIVKLTAREHYIAHLLLAKIHGGKLWAAVVYMSKASTKSAKGVDRVGSRLYEKAKIEDSAWRSEAYSGENGYWYGKRMPWKYIEKMRGSRPSIAGELNPNFGKNFPERGLVISSVKRYKPVRFKVNTAVAERINKTIGVRRMSGKKYVLPEGLRELRHYIIFKYVGKRDKTGSKNPNYGNGQAISGSKNPMWGTTRSEETKRKISEKAKRRITCPHCGKDGNIANMKRWHFENCRAA